MGLEDHGFRAVIAPSFADIFRTNCTKIGLLPVELPEDAVRALMEQAEETRLGRGGSTSDARWSSRPTSGALRDRPGRARAAAERLGRHRPHLAHEDEIAAYERERGVSGHHGPVKAVGLA